MDREIASFAGLEGGPGPVRTRGRAAAVFFDPLSGSVPGSRKRLADLLLHLELPLAECRQTPNDRVVAKMPVLW